MRAELAASVDEIREAAKLLRQHIDFDRSKARLAELNALAEDPNLWNDPERAQKLMQERGTLEDGLGALERIERELADNVELIEMGEADRNDSYLEIHPGAGGTESQDWAEMLLRMYTRWAEGRGFKVELVDEQAGETAGLKSATILVKGHNAYGWMKTEAGVHRLVRISPFDSNSRRHTSFASVFAYPEVGEDLEIELKDEDLKIDVYRSGGAGGQHVNKTSSAVRITHLPTGIVAECQDDRSQHRNKAKALQVLAARIEEKARSEQAAKDAAMRKGLIGSGDRSDRIRTYNFPQGRLTDHRINLTLYKLPMVMEGDLKDVVAALQAERAAEQLAELELGGTA